VKSRVLLFSAPYAPYGSKPSPGTLIWEAEVNITRPAVAFSRGRSTAPSVLILPQIASMVVATAVPTVSGVRYRSEGQNRNSGKSFLRGESSLMAKLTTAARKKLPKSDFVEKSTRKYPIPDAAHARDALARSSGKPEHASVVAAVKRKFPKIKITTAK